MSDCRVCHAPMLGGEPVCGICERAEFVDAIARYEKALREIASADTDQVLPGYEANEIAREALGLPKLWSE